LSKWGVVHPTVTINNFPIVGIGASAGGLEAFVQVFSKMPADIGMAFVLVQHLDPTHPSLSTDIISKSTQLKVEEVKDGIRVQPNHAYVLPPNHNVKIENGVLNLSARGAIPGQNMPIDFFFQSLAQSLQERAIGIVLSGTGTDGTTGLWAIKADGGLTYAQDPASAKYPGMPESAIDSGAVDLILHPENVASELLTILKQSSGTQKPIQSINPPIDSDPEDSFKRETMNRLFSILRAHKKVDFSGYKQSTVMRRIQRRMTVHKTKTLLDYIEYIEAHHDEVHSLYNDILINVTDFFRDPESFASLTKKIFPPLLEGKSNGDSIRIWVPGCSTGEEAYSIAITLLECLDSLGKQNSVQIFATDISERSIRKARIGRYSESLLHGVSKERLERFFDRVEGGYQVNRRVRDLCLFSRHDVTNDPPFAKLDLISCRNVMIYFSNHLQKRVIPIFHYALLPSGSLWLGRAENLGEYSQLFDLVEKEHKIYTKSTPNRMFQLQ
jgi:two-component system, chemotaxis family, CheB/CheR fusion protein